MGRRDDDQERQADAVASEAQLVVPGGRRMGRVGAGVVESGDEASGVSVAVDPGIVEDVIRRPATGEGVPDVIRARVEPVVGRDLSGVRVHHDAAAGQAAEMLRARAFAVGRHVFLGRGESPGDLGLMAHELAHAARALRGTSAEGALVPGPVVRCQPSEGEDRLPEPMDVAWGADRFRLQFRREESSMGDARLRVEVRYLGSLPVQGPGIDGGVAVLEVGIAPRRLQAEVRRLALQEVVVDLYGDRVHTLRVQDDIRHDDRSFSFGRQHDLSLVLNGQTRHARSLWVLDPASTPAETRPFEPEFLPGTAPEFQGMVNPVTHKLELTAAIDGDGDQHPELEMTVEADSFMAWAGQMQAEEPIRVLLQPVGDPASRRASAFVVRAPPGAVVAPGGDTGVGPGPPANALRLAAKVRELTDGSSPVVLDLTDPPTSEQLRIFPPVPEANGVSYLVRKGGQSVRYVLPVSPAAPRPAVEAGPGAVLGRIAFWDLTLGPYGDRFRLLIDRGITGQVIAGLTPLSSGAPYGGAGIPIQMTGSVGAVRLLQNGPVRVALDFNGDGQPDLTLFDRLQASSGTSPEQERLHTIRLSGPAVGTDRTVTFRANPNWIQRDTGGAMSSNDRRAHAAARATQGLLESQGAGNFGERLLAFEAAMLPLRRQAVDQGWIRQGTFDAWNLAELHLIRVEAQGSAGSVEAALANEAATHVRALYDALESETAGEARTQFSQAGHISDNPYTGRQAVSIPGNMGVTHGAGARAAEDLRAGRWGAAIGKYRVLRAALDRWIVERARRAGVTGEQMNRLKASTAILAELGQMADRNPIRIHAVFRPDEKFRGEAGFTEQVPLELYCWREGNEWRLVDLTNPERPFRDSVTARATDFDSVAALLGELDNEDHFCEGRIYYEVPGIATGQIQVEDRVTWRDFFTWLGIGLAVVGTVLSFGTGAVAVAGTWALVGSAVAGGTAATLNLIESARHGTATTTSVLLDLTQVVASVAGVGALAAGRVLSVARTSAAAGSPLTGARWASLATLAQRCVIPLAATNLTADAITLAVVTVQGAEQLDAIENGPGTPDAKRRAKLRLLAQQAFTGGLTALSLRGNAVEIRMGRSIEIINVRGEPVVVPVGLSTSGRAVSETAARVTGATDDAARAAAEQAHLATIRQRLEGPTGQALAHVEELGLASQAGRADAVLTLDAAGTLARGGEAAGTLDQLTERVAQANNASRAHGIDLEYVLDLRPGAAAGTQECRIVRRSRTPGTGADPRRLYVDVAARTAAEARELARLRTSAGPGGYRVEVSPDGLLRLNGQIDLHPSRLAEIPDADLAVLASSTRALDSAGGDMTVLARTNPEAHSRLERFASSSPLPHSSGRPGRGYRLRFAHSHRAGLALVDDLLAQLGTTRARHPAFRQLTPHDLDRLYDLTTESMPGGTTHAQTQAARYALDQNPVSGAEFVNHYQFYVAEMRDRIRIEAEARRAAGQAVGKGTLRSIGQQTETAMGEAGNAVVPGAATLTGVRQQYDRLLAQTRGRLGVAQIDPHLSGAPAVEAIRALPEVRFQSDSAAVYHTHKHYHELPSARRPAGTPEFDAYMNTARAVIHNTAETAADVAARSASSQAGGMRSYSFQLSEGGRTHVAFVYVSDDGAVFLATLMPGS